MIGVFLDKAVLAPADRMAWLRGMVLTLEQRGVHPVLPGDPQVATDLIGTKIYLEKAWITNTASDIGASVSFRVDELTGDQTVTQLHFRGTRQKFTYWSQADSKLQHAIDLAASQALDGMAVHFKTLCTSRY